MRFADTVVPPPLTEIVTAVDVVTGTVVTLNPPLVDPAGIVTPPGTAATAGLLLVTCSVSSVAGALATATVANDPALPDVVAGLKVTDCGGFCGVTVTADRTDVPFQLAVIVARVADVTVEVGSATETEVLPSGTTATGVQWRKICFGNRSTNGELATARLLTVAETCELQRLNILVYLSTAIARNRRCQPATSLLPEYSA